MKRKIALFVAIIFLLMAMLPISAFAHGHGHGGAPVNSEDGTYDICNIDGCDIVSVHWHDGICYTGHWMGDGCDYHQLCTVEGCVKASHHYHDGVVYIPQNNSYALCAYGDCHIAEPHEHGDSCYAGHWAGDGHGHHRVCTVQNCTRTTVHEHNGVTCFPSGRGGGHHRSRHSGRGHHR